MNRARTDLQPVQIIVNADDFGYFDAVSQGILEAAEAGMVTATGVMANGPALDRWIDRLKALPGLSVGVHLNATLGAPLTPGMAEALAGSRGQFPSKGNLASAVLLGRLSTETLLTEWRAQIRRCLDKGLRIEFVNSHEHVHVLPGLYAEVRRLAAELGIRHVRAPQSEWGPRFTPGGVLRSTVFAVAGQFARGAAAAEPVLIGVATSGRLSLDYCRWRFARLRRSRAYELMCHPGRADPLARAIPQLAAYHDWEGELGMLLSPAFTNLLREQGLRLASYADLDRA